MARGVRRIFLAETKVTKKTVEFLPERVKFRRGLYA
jgi:hypothetical protein